MEHVVPILSTVPPASTNGCFDCLQELVADDNAEHAVLFLPFTSASASCLYKFNRHDYHFQCLLLGLEWHRAEQAFRCALNNTNSRLGCTARLLLPVPAAGAGVHHAQQVFGWAGLRLGSCRLRAGQVAGC